MRLRVKDIDTFVATGGRQHDTTRPAVIFLHGAGQDHTVWALLARWFAHRGFAVLAPDLPGHGHSGGKPLSTISSMADWTVALIEAAAVRKAAIVGHSMGSLIALELAAHHPDKVSALGLIGTAAAMPVARELLDAAAANDPAAIDMLTIWGYGSRAGIGGSLAPGLWMMGGGVRLLERAQAGVLFHDLAACNDYRDGLGRAAKVTVPTIMVLGERDLMTPAKAGRDLAAALPNARVVTLAGAGHMLMSERPDQVLGALRDLARA